MAAALTTVTSLEVNPGQAPGPAGAVAISAVLISPSGAFLSDGTAELVGAASTSTDATGSWSLALTPNTSIIPSGTYYSVTIRAGGVSAVHNINVPVSATPVQLGSILVSPSAVGGLAPAGGDLAGSYPNPTLGVHGQSKAVALAIIFGG